MQNNDCDIKVDPRAKFDDDDAGNNAAAAAADDDNAGNEMAQPEIRDQWGTGAEPRGQDGQRWDVKAVSLNPQ